MPAKSRTFPEPFRFALSRYFSKAMAFRRMATRCFLVTGTQIRSWDLRTQIELEPMSYPLGRMATFLAVSPEGLLAAAHWNGHVTLWDFKTRQLLHTFEAHLAWVSSVVFSPDGSYPGIRQRGSEHLPLRDQEQETCCAVSRDTKARFGRSNIPLTVIGWSRGVQVINHFVCGM